MSSQAITLHIPQNMFSRFQRMAQVVHQPLETVVYQSLQGNLPPLIEDTPEEWRSDLTDMEQLDDADIWKVAKEPLSQQQWTRHQELLAKNEEGTLTGSERQELQCLRSVTDRFVFRRSYALALLKWRGHTIVSDIGLLHE
jgi:hypothetical protein